MAVFRRFFNIYAVFLRWIIFAMVFAAGTGVFVMIVTTCADVIGRRLGFPLVGAYDIVKITGAVTLSLALPYTTAVKGHVAIEYFFHKLGRRSRIVVDFFMRLSAMILFTFLSYRSFIYGSELYKNGQVTQTLKMPVFWVPYLIGICCFIVVLVILGHILRPGREMIKP